jgi:hypothetical protein
MQRPANAVKLVTAADWNFGNYSYWGYDSPSEVLGIGSVSPMSWTIEPSRPSARRKCMLHALPGFRAVSIAGSG